MDRGERRREENEARDLDLPQRITENQFAAIQV